jgi:chromodomain-helicase-DNA-binding protein 4
MLQGTPLQNNMLELFSLLHYIDPDEFTDPKADDLFTPIESGNELTMEEKIARIHDILKPRCFNSLIENAIQSISWMWVLSSCLIVLSGC